MGPPSSFLPSPLSALLAFVSVVVVVVGGNGAKRPPTSMERNARASTSSFHQIFKMPLILDSREAGFSRFDHLQVERGQCWDAHNGMGGDSMKPRESAPNAFYGSTLLQ
uniref:Secreted protein n=1 Tax=Panagrellus redivivus TaxID=6233 RepID=A0A7E5A0B1_PANRE